MAEDLIYTTLSAEDKVTLNHLDIFDRVINLKIKTKKFNTLDDNGKAIKAEDEFIIRSDYEFYFPKQDLTKTLQGERLANNWIIRKCEIKPSIKVQYKRLTSGTSIAVDIFITNFFMTSKDGRTLMSFNQRSYDIAEIEVQMGYIGQFNSLLGLISTVNKDGSVNKGKKVSELTLDDLYDFKEGFGVETLKVTDVEYVKVEKLVPDYTLHIHGFVGSTTTLSNVTEEDYIKYADIPKEAYFSTSKDKEKSVMENLFFNYVTKRYLNIKVMDKRNLPDVKPDKDGFYSDADAEAYGIKVVCSDGVKNLKLPSMVKDGKEVEKEIASFIFLGGDNNTANSAMERLCEYTNHYISYSRLNNGSFLVFTTEEFSEKGISKLFENVKEFINQNAFGTFYKNRIPAVYNVSLDALATITCPFVTWINPLQDVYFASKYVLTSMVTFYAGFSPAIYRFFIINVQVSFATVEDLNEMTIVAVPDYSYKGD